MFITRLRKHSLNIQIEVKSILVNVANRNTRSDTSVAGQFDEMIGVSKPAPLISEYITPAIA